MSHTGKIEEERRKKILSARNKESRLGSLSAGCLLHHALCERLGLSEDYGEPFQVGYGQGGKPYLKEYADIHFNLSHSGGYVCCAVGDEPVGVDIQRAAEVREGLAGRFFTREDNRRLESCGGRERKELFFRMWSIKESYIKLTGRGLSGGLDTFEIDWQGKRIFEKGEPAAYFTERRDLPAYSFCVCGKEPLQEIVWKTVFLS